jgi:hypothetical protein
LGAQLGTFGQKKKVSQDFWVLQGFQLAGTTPTMCLHTFLGFSEFLLAF